MAHPLHALEAARAGAGSARIDDLLLPRLDFGHVAREIAACAPEIDLEGKGVLPRHVFDDPFQRRVGDEAAIPIMLALDLNGGKAGRQRAARHDVLGADAVRRGVEVDQIARTHIDGADREAH